MYISLWENYRGHPDNISFMQFSTLKLCMVLNKKIHRALRTHTTLYEQYPLEKFFIFTIYQNYTLALNKILPEYKLCPDTIHVGINIIGNQLL